MSALTGMLGRVGRRYPTLKSKVPHYWLFCARVPLRITLRYLTYARQCRNAFTPGAPPSATTSAAAARLRRDGFVVLPPVDARLVKEIGARVGALVPPPGTAGDDGGESWMIQLPDVMGRVPEAVELLDAETVAVVEAYYRAHFKIFCVEIYRTVPTAEAPRLSSRWHIDNYPPGMLKAFVYLTDCDRTTGALNVHPRRRSRELIRAGFFDRMHAERFAAELDRDPIPVEGPAGTVILWDQNLVHRAVAPVTGHRDAVSIKLLPSIEPWRRHLARMGAALSYERRGQYPLDPADD